MVWSLADAGGQASRSTPVGARCKVAPSFYFRSFCAVLVCALHAPLFVLGPRPRSAVRLTLASRGAGGGRAVSLTSPPASPASPSLRDEWRAHRGSSPVYVRGIADDRCDLQCLLDRWWLLPHVVTAALGVPVRRVDEVDESPAQQPVEASDAAGRNAFAPADVLLLGVHRSNVLAVASEALAGAPHCLVVHGSFEPLDYKWFHWHYEPIDDGAFDPLGLPGIADINLSGARTLEHLWRHVTWPPFLYVLVDRTAAVAAAAEAAAATIRSPAPPLDALCPLRAFPPSEPAWWHERRHFALFLARHTPPPRDALHALLASDAAPREGRAVDHPGPIAEWKNLAWPPTIPNDKRGRVMLMKRYRFVAAVEPVARRGFVSHRLVEAHLSGAVPIYWGDVASFPTHVFNPARVLWFDPERDLPNATGPLLTRVHELEEDARARADFFAQPVLAPGAQEWVHAACAAAAGKLSRALVHLVRPKAGARERAAPASGSYSEEDGDSELRQALGWPARGGEGANASGGGAALPVRAEGEL